MISSRITHRDIEAASDENRAVSSPAAADRSSYGEEAKKILSGSDEGDDDNEVKLVSGSTTDRDIEGEDRGDGGDEAKKSRRTRSGESLVRFFAEVGVVKAEMEQMKRRMKTLEEGGDEEENIWEEVMGKARAINAKLESLDVANEENRAIEGCEAGSSTDRTRLNITASLRSEVAATSFTPILQHKISSLSTTQSHLAELQQIFTHIALPPAEHLLPPQLASVSETPSSATSRPYPFLASLNISSGKCKCVALLIFLLVALAILVTVLLVKLL